MREFQARSFWSMTVKSLKRLAFVMHLHPGQEAEYRARHSPIWPELESLFEDSGVYTYSIFFHSLTNQLFAYAEVEDVERWERIAASDVCKRWWQYMKEIMPSEPDGRPVSAPLAEVFSMDISHADGKASQSYHT